MCFMHCAITCSNCSSFIEHVCPPRVRCHVKLAVQGLTLQCFECCQKSESDSGAPSLLLQQLPRRARVSKANSLGKFNSTVSNIDEDKESQGSSDVELQSADEDNDDEDFEA